MANNIFADFRVGDSIRAASVSSPVNDGIYTLTSISDGFIGVTPAPAVALAADTTFTVLRNYSGTRTIAGVGDGFIELSGTTFAASTSGPANIDPATTTPVSEWTDWIEQTGADQTETWVNIVAAQGMFKDDGGKAATTVVVEWQVEKLHPQTLEPTGVVETFTGSISGSVADERAESIEHLTAWVGARRTRARRLTPFDYDFKGTVVDEVKWVDLQAVSPVDRQHFGNKTTIHTVTYATTRATAVKSRQLNCLASRRIPKWTGAAFTGGFDAEGRHTWGEIFPSSLIHEIIAAVTLDKRIGNRPASELDMVQMQGAVDALLAIHPELPTFNYTFDDDGMTLESTVKCIADAGCAIAYRQNGKIRLSADRKQSTSVALFTHRNKEPNAETISRSLVNDSGYDGVELTYQDPDTEAPEVIRLPLDGSAQRPKPIELPGMRSFAQAWLRANREFNKVLYRRFAIDTSCTTDARVLIPNARVDIVDNTLFRSFDGEVRAQNGLVLTLSQPVEFALGQPHSIVLMDRDGTPLQGIACTPGPDRNQVVLQALPAQPIVTEYGQDGIRTIFSFASDSDREKDVWLVEEIDPPDGRYMKVRAFNYSDRYYDADTQPIPARGSIINS
ncbi:hypothetical protein GN316_15305 [Xylophilus sp. Kf1]|nr:hypothetical protein [Xylophilus sp. Kf1]